MQSERLRVLTYNIHKGVQGLGPLQRLEIYNVQQAIARLNLDVVCLQEVRRSNSQGMLRFADWPRLPQADFLAPHGFSAVYVTNAYTRYGEHGNALLSRWPVVQQGHQDISDHRYEQRGLLHSVIDFQGVQVHVIVVHLGLIAGAFDGANGLAHRDQCQNFSSPLAIITVRPYLCTRHAPCSAECSTCLIWQFAVATPLRPFAITG